MASDATSVEHCLAFEFNDHETRKGYAIPEGIEKGKSVDLLTNFITTPEMPGVSAVANWNAAASISNGELLLIIADDLIPEKDWDASILRLLSHCDLTEPSIFKFTDFRCSESYTYPYGDIYLPRHPMVNRAFIREKNYLFNPNFEGVGADDDLLIEGISKGIIWDFRSIRFHHSIGEVLDDMNAPSCGCVGNESSGIKTNSQIAIHQKKIDIKSTLIKNHTKGDLLRYRLACIPQLVSKIRAIDQVGLGFGEKIKFRSLLQLLIAASLHKARGHVSNWVRAVPKLTLWENK